MASRHPAHSIGGKGGENEAWFVGCGMEPEGAFPWAERDNPATWPAAIVHIERDVPGKTAARISTAPIQIACTRLTSFMSCVRDTMLRYRTAP